MENSTSELPQHSEASTSGSQTYNETEKNEETTTAEQSKRPNLPSLQIPTRSLEHTLSYSNRIDVSSLSSPGSSRAGLPPRPSSTKFRSMKNLLPQRSFKGKNVQQEIQDAEESAHIIPDLLPSDGSLEKRSTQRSFSLNKVFFSSSTKTSPVANSGPILLQGKELGGHSSFPKVHVSQDMKRSLSVPVNLKNRSARRINSMGSLIRVIPASPHTATVDVDSTSNPPVAEIAREDGCEDIFEEDAVCRICLIELTEGGDDTLMLDCSCKGDLALAHQECALKWFSIKGNKTCDVCKQEVRNLPVTLLKLPNPQIVIRRPTHEPVQQTEATRYRVWQDVPVLVMVSMLSYFCFLEQLLISDMGSHALAISLPFSFVLGLLSSMIASTLVSKGYLWAYACFQFALVMLFAHIFYSILELTSILAIILSSFTGFGIAISANSLLVEYFRWRTNRAMQSYQQHQQQQPQEHHQNHHNPQQIPETINVETTNGFVRN